MFRNACVLLLVALAFVMTCEAQNAAMDLSLRHSDRNGRDRPVFRGRNANGGGSLRNHPVNTQVGLDTTVFRSRNGRHSVVGATRDLPRYYGQWYYGVWDLPSP